MRWKKHLTYSVRRAFKKLYHEHRWYIKKNRKAYLSNNGHFDSLKYNYSIQRLKQITNCQIFFNSVQLIKQSPHNGCRLKKVHIRCKDIKRINRRRMSR